MSHVEDVDPRSETVSRWPPEHVAAKVVVIAALTAVAVYAVGDVLAGLVYEGYSHADQAISELSAFGSPVRPLMVTAIVIHSVLLVVMGVGVRRLADARALRWVGTLLIAVGVLGIPNHTMWAISSRGMEAGFNDTMHIILSVVFSLLVFVAIVLAATAYRGWFRLYSFVTLAVLIGFGAATSIAMAGIDEDDTPWAGAFERVNAYAYFAWLIVLALTITRRALGTQPRRPGH